MEQELYLLIACIMREMLSKQQLKDILVRDVSLRRRPRRFTDDGAREKKTDGSYDFWGIGGYPDLLVVDKQFGTKTNGIDNIHLALEAKYIGEKLVDFDALTDGNMSEDKLKNKLITKKDYLQLMGSILWFKKVIYTDGVTWSYYVLPEDDAKEELIAKLQSATYNEKSDDVHQFTDEEKDLYLQYVKIKPINSFELDFKDYKDDETKSTEEENEKWMSFWNDIIKNI